MFHLSLELFSLPASGQLGLHGRTGHALGNLVGGASLRRLPPLGTQQQSFDLANGSGGTQLGALGVGTVVSSLNLLARVRRGAFFGSGIRAPPAAEPSAAV